MRRRRVEEKFEHHDRWFVSYADFITLLFAFFVVMYEASSINETKYREITGAMEAAFNQETPKKSDKGVIGVQNQTTPAESSIPLLIEPIDLTKIKTRSTLQLDPPKPAGAPREKLQAVEEDLSSTLRALIDGGKIRIVETAKGIRIDINESLLFGPGSSHVGNAEAIKTLDEIAAIILQNDYAVEIEGHTDNVPIKNHFFASNWELSAIRATTVLNIFSQKGISERRLSASGFGASRPIAPNDSSEGKAKNRRVSIMLLRDSSSQPGSDLLAPATELPSKPGG